ARRILLVEDNPVNQLYAQALLQSQGHEVVLASDGREAVSRVREHDFDLVLMDCHMPGMDGYEATRRIRALPAPRGEVPVVALTASAMAGDRERCLSAGPNDLLAKPFTPQEMAAMISRAARQA